MEDSLQHVAIHVIIEHECLLTMVPVAKLEKEILELRHTSASSDEWEGAPHIAYSTFALPPPKAMLQRLVFAKCQRVSAQAALAAVISFLVYRLRKKTELTTERPL